MCEVPCRRVVRAWPALVALLVATLLPAIVAAQGERPFNQGWASGTPTIAIGVVTILYADDFAHQQAQLVHLFRDERTGESFRLRFEHDAPKTVRSGARIQVAGRTYGTGAYGSELYVAGCCDSATSTTDSTGRTLSTGALASGDQHALVMIANFRDATVSCSKNAIDDAMFSDPGGLSVNGLYKASSIGRVSFSGQVVGPYPLTASSADSCDMSGWADAADAQATSAGLDLTAYPRKVYVMPPNTCPGAGLGTVGTVQNSRAWIFSCDLKGVFAHEIGHNLGMDHASTPTQEYGDSTDPMAIGSWMLHGVNAPHRLAMGWLAATDAPIVSESGEYDVAALATDPAQATAPQTIRIAKPDTLEYYYLSYRTPAGVDSYIDGSYYYRLSVHSYNSDGTLAKTYLLAGLGDGETFTDAINGLTITQTSHDASHATARIAFASTCVASSPAITLTPQTQSAPAGSSVNYTVSITNRNASTCPSSTFSLSDAGPSGWTTAVSPASLTLGSGATGQAVATLVSAPAAPIGTYNATINASDVTMPTAVASTIAAYTVQAPKDGIAPSAPSALTASVNQKRKQIALSWKAASDNVGVAGYRVWRNGTLAATTTTTGWTDQAWSAGATYTYSVSAYDAAGNMSAPGSTATVTLPGGGGTGGTGGGKKP
jgi:hypothetical protein